MYINLSLERFCDTFFVSDSCKLAKSSLDVLAKALVVRYAM